MQRLRYSPEEEQLLMTQLWSPQIASNPETFVLFAFPWGQKNTPLERFKGPRKWQREVLREIADFIRDNRSKIGAEEMIDALRSAVSSGRGVGKSALVSWLILWMLSTRIGSSVVVSANSETQLRTVTWGELTKWATMSINAHWWEPSATKLAPAAWLTDLVERDLKKGTRYWGAEGKLWSEENPDAYAGVHNMDGMMESSTRPAASRTASGAWRRGSLPRTSWIATGWRSPTVGATPGTSTRRWTGASGSFGEAARSTPAR